MHRDRRFKHGPRFFRPWGGFWLIILAIIVFKGHWWPGILVLVGLGIVFSSLFRGPAPRETQNPPPPVTPVAPRAAPIMAAAPVEQTHRSDLLPATCPRCGGPIRSHEVQWTGKQSAACPYCGSNLPMKKP
jgi:DNA-directed RNA polymerase subunit RPC12/RpoP